MAANQYRNDSSTRYALERLLSQTNTMAPGGCWLFLGLKDEKGYGVAHGCGQRRAHRLAWTTLRGEIPEGMHVLHKCDVRNCCNPAHLYLGTHADNMRDMNVRGRHVARRGETHAQAKLRKEDVISIRQRWNGGHGERQVDLAQEFGVSQAAISAIVKRVVWRHIE